MEAAEKLLVLVRASLAEGVKSSPAWPSSPALLLEGEWPPDGTADCVRLSLDELFDSRHAWIDDEAARLAEELAERGLQASGLSVGRTGWLPWLDNLKLRYFLVRLIRVVAFFEHCGDASAATDQKASVELHTSGPRDEDHALLMAAICQSRGLKLAIVLHGDEAAVLPPAIPANPPPRPRGGKMAALLGWPFRRTVDSSAPRVVLCGNPALLDPLCGGLLTREAAVGWLWDRFPVQWFRQWRGRVQPLVCDAAVGGESRLAVDTWGPLECRGVDLAEPVQHWLAGRAACYGAWQTRLVERVEQHLARFEADIVVLDEDSTPTARAVIGVARELGIASVVLQHGAPYVRFGYAPVAADRICVLGEASRQRFLSWGVPEDRISVTGSPKHDGMLAGLVLAPVLNRDQPRVLILATLPPSDDRPDSVALHFTTETHRGMLRAALGGTAAHAGARAVLKLHPRLASEQVFREVLAEYPGLDVQIVRGGDLAAQVAGSNVVLSCASSAGVEAAAWGRPVIELLPVGSETPLPAESWGLLGVARTADEVAGLIAQALASDAAPADPRVFANLDRSAVEQILEVVESLLPATALPSGTAS